MRIENPPVDLELSDQLVLRALGKTLAPDIRTLAQMTDVLMEPQAVSKLPPSTPLYYMYRAVHTPEAAKLFEKTSLRYDVTVVADTHLGGEYNKTLGHYHEMHDARLSFPELYEVLHGEAKYVLQERKTPSGEEAGRVFVVRAKAGDKLIVPANFGHVTTNVGRGPLVMDNVVEAHFKSDYAPYKARKGAAVYVTEKGLQRNPKYPEAGEAVEVGAPLFNRMVSEKLAAQLQGRKSYALFLEKPSLFQFLTEPSLAQFRE